MGEAGELGHIAFAEPAWLWLLLAPVAIALIWVVRFAARRADIHELSRRRVLPVRERFAFAGDLPFWLCLVLAVACLVLALARPRGTVSIVTRGGVDLVVLQDASASMYVNDVPGSRWQRSMRFLRLLADSLAWDNDRMALAVFAHIAAPQIRLTRDPNTFFFFLDHLSMRPPFRLEDDATWDTNMELGVHWGVRLIERDQELHGKSTNGRAFVLLSDGEAWSGEVAESLKRAKDANIPVFVIGVGTLRGGAIPTAAAEVNIVAPPSIHSRLDRAALSRIAAGGGGQYFELDRDEDRRIANTIIDAGRRRASPTGVVEQAQELYWWLLGAAGVLVAVGLLFLRERAELAIQLVCAAAALASVWRLLE